MKRPRLKFAEVLFFMLMFAAVFGIFFGAFSEQAQSPTSIVKEKK